MSELRDYQVRALTLLRERWRERPILALPTGAGKTTVAAEIIRGSVAKGRRAIFLVHRIELVDQAVARLEQFGLRPGRIVAGEQSNLDRPVQVASIPTLIRREHWPADVVIVDECAHAVSDSWRTVIERYAGSALIGLTATPMRLDGRGLGDMFGAIIEPVTVLELIEKGYLVNPTVYAPPVDLKGVRLRAGEYDLPELAERMSKLTGSITQTWRERANGARTVVFACNVEHSRAIVEAFREIGYDARHVDYETPARERAETLALLRDGKLPIVSQVMLLSEGWDLPTLQCVILARPTKSVALFRQMVGRVLRPPGPVLVLDHAGNHHEHGAVTDPIKWSLDAKKKAEPTGESVRTCLECYAVIPPDAEFCSECGAPVPKREEQQGPGVHNPGELVEFRRPDPVEAKVIYRGFVEDAARAGYSIGQARHRYKHDFGVWPQRMRDIEKQAYRCPGHIWAVAKLGPRRVMRCAKCYVERAQAVDPFTMRVAELFGGTLEEPP